MFTAAPSHVEHRRTVGSGIVADGAQKPASRSVHVDQAITGATSAGSAGGGDGASEWGSTHEVGLEAAAVTGVEQAVQPQTAIGCTIQAITIIDLQLPVQHVTQGMRIREHRAKLNTLTNGYSKFAS